jgi:phage terminase Nu1 subunit (DNA packaging protein)
MMNLYGAGATTVSRWKKQYLAEVSTAKGELDSDKRHIQVLEKQLADSKRDVALLK